MDNNVSIGKQEVTDEKIKASVNLEHYICPITQGTGCV